MLIDIISDKMVKRKKSKSGGGGIVNISSTTKETDYNTDGSGGSAWKPIKKPKKRTKISK
ncbi:unnamed protein product [marine sediment metagenome]|uniref:Uncharacterized protein n=1 Tax=marine sediment metagenome TaxID=412755 RepID=X1DXJ6_9ZZZZ